MIIREQNIILMVLMLYSFNNRVQLNEHVIIKQKIEPFSIENALSIYDTIIKED